MTLNHAPGPDPEEVHRPALAGVSIDAFELEVPPAGEECGVGEEAPLLVENRDANARERRYLAIPCQPDQDPTAYPAIVSEPRQEVRASREFRSRGDPQEFHLAFEVPAFVLGQGEEIVVSMRANNFPGFGRPGRRFVCPEAAAAQRGCESDSREDVTQPQKHTSGS